MRSDLAVFGYVAQGVGNATRARFSDFTERLRRAVHMEVAIFEATSYEDLSTAIQTGYVDLAWLPPVPLLALDDRSAIVPLVAHRRADGFHSALIVDANSGFHALADLRGARAAWVDHESASGYLLARIALGRAGVDPRRAFSEERFFGSHEAVARAIVRRVSDVGATYAGVDAEGKVTRAPWLALDGEESARVRVLARVDDVPSDATVARAGLPSETRERFAAALVAMADKAKGRALVARLFGIQSFVPWRRSGHEAFRRTLAEARRAGVLSPAPDVERLL